MVLLKGYFSTSEQANILKKCRDHGMGPVGFYEPCFREGGKLHLSMMCFGQFWDPDASKYVKNRPIDQAKPPSLPHEFLMTRIRVGRVLGKEYLLCLSPLVTLQNFYMVIRQMLKRLIRLN
ncbi:uncharacterized protein LOC110703639 isoform X1 [Chenopodium quinoa]|uniref:uncharacterized protein LOC110703639 isoform X1 n=1 Tax=Chenopodium quinoa TaxID=63459 RepID=UPI000B770757|nr:uncharacterized protein LOC110703639 isoform X1 [Chenopodium quinoa]